MSDLTPEKKLVGLRPAEREALYAPDRRLNAYYFSFEPTGSPAIDAILSAVAYAGKGFHHTEPWGDEYSRWGEGRSYVDVIQAAANEAANKLGARAEVERLTAAVEAVRALHQPAGRHNFCGTCAYAPWPCATYRALPARSA